MTTISAKFSEKELDYLSQIASENTLYKGSSKEPSLGKAMKELIKWCQVNKININQNNSGLDSEYKKMIEQIHVAIPNLMYLARLQTLLGSEAFSDEHVLRCKQQTVDYLDSVCGDFQSVNYNEVHVSTNDLGLNQLPIKKGKSKWKRS